MGRLFKMIVILFIIIINDFLKYILNFNDKNYFKFYLYYIKY